MAQPHSRASCNPQKPVTLRDTLKIPFIYLLDEKAPPQTAEYPGFSSNLTTIIGVKSKAQIYAPMLLVPRSAHRDERLHKPGAHRRQKKDEHFFSKKKLFRRLAKLCHQTLSWIDL